MSFDARGTFGFSAGLGFARCGYSRCASSKDYGGIYASKRTKQGIQVSRMVYYRTSNPQTTRQQTWRAVFRTGFGVWRGLTTSQKALLSKQARNLRMTGFNLFMRRYLSSHYPV